MHGLSTIQKLNANATAKAIEAARASGQHVTVLKAGAHIHSHSVHGTAAAAVGAAFTQGTAHAAEITHTEILPPLGEAQAALVRGRDQSEDYVAPAAPVPWPVHVWVLVDTNDECDQGLVTVFSTREGALAETHARIDAYVDGEGFKADYVAELHTELDRSARESADCFELGEPTGWFKLIVQSAAVR